MSNWLTDCSFQVLNAAVDRQRDEAAEGGGMLTRECGVSISRRVMSYIGCCHWQLYVMWLSRAIELLSSFTTPTAVRLS